MKNVFNVIRARFLISMKIYFRYPINLVLTLFDPLIWLTPFYFMGRSFSSNGSMPGFEKYTGNSDFIGYLVIGYMVNSYVSTVFWSLGFSLKEEMRMGVLESNWSAPVNRVLLLISKSLFSFCATTVEVLITGVVCHFVFGFTITPSILRVIMYLIPGIIGMLGLGLMVSSLVLLAREATAIIDITSSTLSAFSGGFFPIKAMPRGLTFISFAIPLTYIYDSTRTILINQTPLIPLKYEFIIILAAMVIFLVLGNYVFMKVEGKCRDMGILGTH